MMKSTTHNTGVQAALLALLADRPAGATKVEIVASGAGIKHLGTYILRLLAQGRIGYLVEARLVGRGRPAWRYFAAEHCPPGAILLAKPPRAPKPKKAASPKPTKPPRPLKPPKVAKAPKPKKAPKPPKVAEHKPLAAIPATPNYATIVKPKQAPLTPAEAFRAAEPCITERTKVTIWQPQVDPRDARHKPAPPLFGKMATGRAPQPRPWAAAVIGGGCSA